jgi:YidC/Oxa1 family membrane protein insertase
MALKSAYYVVAFLPVSGPASAYARALPTPPTEEQRYLFGVAAPAFAVGPGESNSQRFDVYLGPKEREYLAAAWPSLNDTRRYFSQRWNFMDRFAKFLLWMLNGFYAVIPSYGIAIILLTILVRGVMFPLTFKSMKSMKRMQKLAPELEALKEKYKDDQQEFQKQMMQLYREKGINPVSSCLPMLLQLPVFIALYRMLWTSYELRGAPFVLLNLGDYRWISDLSEPDALIPLPFLSTVPFVGEYIQFLNLLPILGGVAIWVSSKFMTPTAAVQSEQQKIITNIMPIFMVVVVYNMAAGLNLYILTSTVLGIAQNKLISLSKDDEEPQKESKAPKKRRNFYAAAQERKRRMAKEARQSKNKGPKNPRGGKRGAR